MATPGNSTCRYSDGLPPEGAPLNAVIVPFSFRPSENVWTFPPPPTIDPAQAARALAVDWPTIRDN